eukprot:11971044-Alexandrium_andersonii.AAC.1
MDMNALNVAFTMYRLMSRPSMASRAADSSDSSSSGQCDLLMRLVTQSPMLKSVAEAFGSSGSVDRALKARTIYVKNLFLGVLDFIRDRAAADRFSPLSDPAVSV